jgi:hypothetical protein
MEKSYDPNLFEVDVRLKLLVTASNPTHAIARVQVLLDSRITQYVHPEDAQPLYKVIALVEQKLITQPPTRKRIIERQSERSEKHDETPG